MSSIRFFKCVVCEGKEVIVQTDFWICKSCKTQFPVINEIPVLVKDRESLASEIRQASQRLPQWYETEQMDEERSTWKHHLKKRRIYIDKKIRQYLESNHLALAENLLDLGCGDGNHLSFLKKFANQVHGSDYNMIRLERAHRGHPDIEIFLANVLDYPAQDGFFDIVFFNHVIEHIPNDLGALEEIARIMKPGGLLIIGTPNEGAWWWQLAYKLQPSAKRNTDHVHFYTAGDLGEKIKGKGFEIVEINHLGWGLPHWSLDAKLRRWKIVDDIFEFVGRIIVPKQASSLYVLAKKV